MDTLHKQESIEFETTIGPKGQITLPVLIRKKLGLEPKDKVAIRMEGDEVKISPQTKSFLDHYMTVPPLEEPLSFEEMRKIAREDHAQEVLKKRA